jgi:Tol biopolymer transport system component
VSEALPTGRGSPRRWFANTTKQRGYAIFAMNADGSSQTNLTRSRAGDITPRWQPGS